MFATVEMVKFFRRYKFLKYGVLSFLGALMLDIIFFRTENIFDFSEPFIFWGFFIVTYFLWIPATILIGVLIILLRERKEKLKLVIFSLGIAWVSWFLYFLFAFVLMLVVCSNVSCTTL